MGYSPKGRKGLDKTERLSLYSSMVPGIDPKAEKKTVDLNQNLYLGYIHLPTHHPHPSPRIAPEKKKLVVHQESNLPLGCTG